MFEQEPFERLMAFPFRLNKEKLLALWENQAQGKSVTCHSMLGLLPQPPAKIENGSIHFKGEDLIHLPKDELALAGPKHIDDFPGPNELPQPLSYNS